MDGIRKPWRKQALSETPGENRPKGTMKKGKAQEGRGSQRRGRKPRGAISLPYLFLATTRIWGGPGRPARRYP